MQSTAERFTPQYEERFIRIIEDLRRHNIYDDNFDQTMKVVAWQLNSKPPFMPFYSVTGIIEGLKSLGNSIPN